MRGTLSLVTAPTVEPVTKEEVRAHLRLDSDTADEDAYLDVLIQTARETVEAHTRRALLAQTWDWKLDTFPCAQPWELPKAPLSSVTSITYLDGDGTTQTWALSNYTVLAPAGPRCMPGTIALAYGVTYPTVRAVPNAVTVRFVAGYGAAATSVPAAIKSAVLLLVGELYARREVAIVGTIISEVPLSVSRLLASYVVHGW